MQKLISLKAVFCCLLSHKGAKMSESAKEDAEALSEVQTPVSVVECFTIPRKGRNVF